MLTTKIAAIYLGLRIEETPTELIVSGPYNAIAPFLPKLKALKFRYHPERNKSWVRTKVRGDTEQTLVKRLFGEAPPTQEEGKTLLKDFPKDKWLLFQVAVYPTGFMQISGETYPLREDFAAANGKWNPAAKAYWFDPQTVNAKGLQTLQKAMEKAEELFAKIRGQAKQEISQWQYPDVFEITLGLTSVQLHLLDKHYVTARPENAFSKARKSASKTLTWHVPFEEIGALPALGKLIEKERAVWEKDEAEHELQQQQEQIQNLEETRNGYKTFKRPYTPYKVGEVLEFKDESVWVVTRLKDKLWLDVEDALSFGGVSLYHRMTKGNGWVYWALARPATETELEASGVPQRQKERNTQRNKGQAALEISKFVQKKGTIPAGNHRVPLGNALYTFSPHLIPYGGGGWVVQDGKDVWYVQNNGSDGDSWDQNNVITGGAGAIGWKHTLTPELQTLLDALH